MVGAGRAEEERDCPVFFPWHRTPRRVLANPVRWLGVAVFFQRCGVGVGVVWFLRVINVAATLVQ